jgi:hypothetical protein
LQAIALFIFTEQHDMLINIPEFFALDFYDKCWIISGKNHKKRRLNHMVGWRGAGSFVEINPNHEPGKIPCGGV